MKCYPWQKSGFTWVEMFVVIATLALVGTVLLPYIAKPKNNGQRITCVRNIKQIGLALRLFSNDHNDKFPWKVLPSSGGADISAVGTELALQYMVLGTNIPSGNVLACPSDEAVVSNPNLFSLSRSNISYFICLEADDYQPWNLLTGDRNITGGTYSNGIYVLPSRCGQAGWGTNMHRSAGNVGLSDGSAQQLTVQGLNKQLRSMPDKVVRLLVP